MDKVIAVGFLLNCGFYGNVESSGILVARRPFYQIPAAAIHPPTGERFLSLSSRLVMERSPLRPQD
jgi:hypothetical protein